LGKVAKNTRQFAPLSILLVLVLSWNACVKKDYESTPGFPETKGELSFFKAANGELAKVDFLDKTVDRFKILDERYHFVSTLQAQYGDVKWDMTMVVKNKDSLYTLVTPFVNERDSVTAMLFAYHQNAGKTVYRIINRENYVKIFDYRGDKDARIINRSTVDGWFSLFSSTYQKLKRLREGKTLARAVFVVWECVRYTWTYGGSSDGSTGFGMSDWQCHYQVYDSGEGVGEDLGENREPDGDDTEDHADNCNCGRGAPQSWVYQENQTQNQIIIDSLNGYPCAQSLVGSIGNLNDSISKLINATFGSGEDYNLTFVPREGMGSIDGERIKASGVPGQTLNVTIALNTDVLSNATKEYILVTMYHEAIHAYLAYEYSRDSVAYNIKFPNIKTYDVVSPNGKRVKKFDLLDDHERFGSFINLLEQSIKSFNPNMPSNIVTAIARMGIVDPSAMTNDQKLLNGYERNVNDGNSRGTKCPTQNN